MGFADGVPDEYVNAAQMEYLADIQLGAAAHVRDRELIQIAMSMTLVRLDNSERQQIVMMDVDAAAEVAEVLAVFVAKVRRRNMGIPV